MSPSSNPVPGEPRYGAGIWHFASYVDRYATEGYADPVTTIEAIGLAGEVGSLSVVDLNWPFAPRDVDLADIRSALAAARLDAIAITPEIYNRDFVRGGFTNPDAETRTKTIDLVSRAAELATDLGCDYVKLWPGQDGVDYPFQANHAELWTYSVEGVRTVARAFPEMRFAIEYKPREPRNRMVFSSAARTLLAVEEMGCDNVGVLLDFGHSLYGGESPAEAARLIMSRDRLFAIDVNDNFRGWDDDMVVGSVHLLETFEFFHALQECNWQGVWQLDQFPFREDSVQAARDGVETMRAIHRGLQLLDSDALHNAQTRQDALAAQRIAKRALFAALAELDGRYPVSAAPTSANPTIARLAVDESAAGRYLEEVDRLSKAGRSERVSTLTDISRSVRRDIVTTIRTAGLGHIGGDLSVTDILVASYWTALAVDPRSPDAPGRDRFVLSKGHCAVALYSVLARCGFFSSENLSTFAQPLSALNGHPNRVKVPGVETNTGPLGHGFPVATGCALGARLRGEDWRTIVVLGDGEIQEGSNWEAAMTAAHYELHSLTAVVDRNRLQQGARTEETKGLEPLSDKWTSFGFETRRIDGHDYAALIEALGPSTTGKPVAIIADTVKGKGVSFIEDRVEWHHKVPSGEQVDLALAELSA